MGDYKGCDMHKKQFPANLIDTEEHEMVKLYAERTMLIDGKKVKTHLFIGKADNEGADVCLADFNADIVEALKATGKTFAWKVVEWKNETVEKRDGSGTYNKLSSTAYTVEEYTAKLKAEADAKKLAPAPKAS